RPSRMRGSGCFPALRMREAVSIYLTLVLVVLGILVASFKPPVPEERPFPYQVPLDPHGRMLLAWNVSFSRETVCFQLLVREVGFGLVFGMSDRGEVSNADLIVLWSDEHGSYFGDAWSDERAQVHLDEHQDYQLREALDGPEGFSLIFCRKFDTCDVRDYLIEDGTVHLLYGFLESPVPSLAALNLGAVGVGVQRVQLLKAEMPKPHLPPDVKQLEILAPNVNIPEQETTYWCYISQLPRHFPKHHIVMYEPVVVKGNEALVHHMEVFQCAAEFDTIPAYSGPCDSKMKPGRLNSCRHVLAAWAMGAKPFYYPAEAGLVIGGPNSSRYLRLEVHYHNPLLLRGRRDSSGIRLHYTPTLRRYDAGIMELGLVYTPLMAIPPHEASWVLTGYCTAQCTQQTLPPSGIHIFASQLHTHLAGTEVQTVLVRNGVQVQVVNADTHYSTHFQAGLRSRLSSQPDGDVLITSCTYSTSARTHITLGGFGIQEEMCVNYVHYYPQSKLELCKSAVDPDSLQKYFRFINSLADDSVCSCPSEPVSQQFQAVSWDSFSKHVLRLLYASAPISMDCNRSSAVRFPGNNPCQKIIIIWSLNPRLFVGRCCAQLAAAFQPHNV
uniref:Dopamine beta-hydroxylase n=1 Tax=Callorhinchus milii TaxID=7868 RepID=A0A4W3IY33_CALMI